MRWSRLVSVILLVGAPLRADQPDFKARLSAAIARAVEKNPTIGEMEARIAAARHRVGQSTALPDPEVEVGLQDVPTAHLSLRRDDFTMEKISARQRFPGVGKRGAQRRFAEAEVASLESMHADHVVVLAAEVAAELFTLAEIDARAGILESSRERLRRAASSAVERYRVGKGAQADVLRANLETTATEERLVALRGERRMVAARFNALQGLPPPETVDPVAFSDVEPSAPAAAELLRDAESRSAAIAAAAADVRRAEEQVRLAHLERRPDWMAATYYAHRIDFEDLAGASIAVNLPFFQPKRLRERESEKEAELSGARASLEAAKNEVRRGASEAYADLERSLEQARLYRASILPQAETNLAAAQEAYTVGQVDFLTYIRAALDRDMYEGELVMRRAAAWRALAALQKASGLPLIEGTPGPGEIHVEK